PSYISLPRSPPLSAAFRTLSVSVTMATIWPSRSTSNDPTRSSRIRRAASCTVASGRIVFSVAVIIFSSVNMQHLLANSKPHPHCIISCKSPASRGQDDFPEQQSITHPLVRNPAFFERQDGVDDGTDPSFAHPLGRGEQFCASAHKRSDHTGLAHVKKSQIEGDGRTGRRATRDQPPALGQRSNAAVPR